MKLIYIVIIAALLITMGSCTKNEVPKPDTSLNKKKIAEATLQGTAIKMTLYSEYDSLFVGYNPLYITLTDTVSKSAVTQAGISVLPVMDMITMKHACPVEQPLYAATDKAFMGAAAFTMATMGNMGWTLDITTTISGTQYKNSIPITVKATGTNIKLVSMVKDNNAVPYFVVLVHPQRPEQKIGLNDLEVAVYKKNTMMDFPAVEVVNLSFIPTMPSMGHSSPNNVNPVSVGKGHYKGKVNFTMTGDWRLDFTLSGQGINIADHAIIDILF